MSDPSDSHALPASSELIAISAALERDELAPNPRGHTSLAARGELTLLRGRLAAVTNAPARDRADVAAALAAASFAAGDRDEAFRLLALAEELAAPGSQRDGMAAARRDPAAFTWLAWAGWLGRHDRTIEAATARAEVRTRSREGALRDAAVAPGAATTPRRSRLREYGPGAAFMGIVVAGITVFAIANRPKSNLFGAAAATSAGLAAEVAGDHALAARGFDHALAVELTDRGGAARRVHEIAGAGTVRVRLAAVGTPFGPHDLTAVEAGLAVLTDLLGEARAAGEDEVARAAAEWLRQLDVPAGDHMHEVAALHLIERLQVAFSDPPSWLRVERKARLRRLARRIGDVAPQAAFHALMTPLEADLVPDAGPYLDAFSDDWVPLAENHDALERWTKLSRGQGTQDARREHLAKAWPAAQARDREELWAALDASEGTAALDAALAAAPGDQLIVAKLLGRHLDHEEAAGVRASAALLPPPARLGALARSTLVLLHREAGEDAAAVALLEPCAAPITGACGSAELTGMLIDLSLELADTGPPAARAAHLERAEWLMLLDEAGAGDDTERQTQLAKLYVRTGRVAQGERLLEELADDAYLATTRAVAEAWVDLNHSDHAVRLLSAAFEGDELDDGQRRALAMRLASLTYGDAARQRYWLERSGDGPAVKADLAELDGREHLARGDHVAADAAFARAVTHHEGLFDDGSTSARNNAALVLMQRTEVTGDVAHQRRAVRLLVEAYGDAPDDPVGLDNLLNAEADLARWVVLEPLVDLRALRLERGEARRVVERLGLGPEGDATAARLRKDGHLGRAMAHARRLHRLWPQREDLLVLEARWAILIGSPAELRDVRERLERRAAKTAPPADDPDDDADARADVPDAGRETDDGAADAGVPAVSADATAPPDARARARVDRLDTRASPATRGVAWFLLGDALEARWAETREAADLAGAVTAFDTAHGHWPALGADDSAAHLRYEQAAAALADDPTVSAFHERHPEGASLAVMYLAVADGEGSDAAVRAVLLGNPGFVDAFERVARSSLARSWLFSLAAARLVGDQAAERKHAARLSQPIARERLRVAGLLNDTTRQEVAWLEAHLWKP